MSEAPDSSQEADSRTSLIALASLFLRLGATAFGGPAAHIAMMQDEVVRRRRWLTDQEFLDLISVTNLIPGPNSTELAIHIGHRQAGFLGLLVAGGCFILPAMTIVMVIAWAYVKYSSLPVVPHLMNGIKPVIIAIVLQAIFTLSKSALKTAFLTGLCIIATVSCFFSSNEILILLCGGALSLIWSWRSKPKEFSTFKTGAVLSLVLLTAALTATFSAGSSATIAPATFSMERLFLYFAKIGSVLYGSGYVLLAFLRSDLVQNWHWLTSSQLLDATAVGQITPGPVFTTATFIGYLLAGISGALIATAGIFLPAFAFVAITAPFIEKLRKSNIAAALLDGVNVASLALMAFVTFALGRDAITTPLYAVEFIFSAILLWRSRLNPTWLIAGGAIVGVLTQTFSQ